MVPLLNYWSEFRDKFEENLGAVTQDDFSLAWKSSTNRTAFYEKTLLQSVATSLKLDFKQEEYKIDYSLCKRTPDGYQVPMVFIESENNASEAHSEIRKLSMLYSPLKVLITCAEWSEEPGYWKCGGMKTNLLSLWANIIKSHNSIWPQLAVTGIIVAEWNTKLRFYSVAFDHLGVKIDQHRILFERNYS